MRKKKTYLLGLAATMFVASATDSHLASAQDYSAVLQQIEQNNTTLKALREQTGASKLEARTGLGPEDPELGLAYLWETKAPEGGHRINIDFTQSFDFPTVYYWRKQISDRQCRAADLEYAIGSKAILLEAEQLCIELSYRRSLAGELERCLDNARRIAATRQSGYDCGEENLLSLNEARLALLKASKLVEENRLEYQAALGELQRLNGGMQVEADFPPLTLPLLPDDFEQWYAFSAQTSSELLASEADVHLSEAERKLAGAEWLPKFSIGYVSERVATNTLEGIGGGISIPLWGNIGKVKAAKAKQAAAQARLEDDRQQFFSALKVKYDKAKGYMEMAALYRGQLSSLTTVELLYEALQDGQIGMEEYLSGIDLWYEALIEVLGTERDAMLLIAEMESFAD